MSGSTSDGFDELDGHILRILSMDPRAPYSEIAARLEEEGYEMSSEGIRYRVSKLMEATRTFFLLDPEDLGWKIVRVAVTTAAREGAKDEAFDRMVELPFWHVSRGLGSCDIFAIGMAPSVGELDAYVTALRELDAVDSVEHTIVTDRVSTLANYYQTDGSDTSHE
jgi:DNA-binding Lrp family transcriptional regulator